MKKLLSVIILLIATGCAVNDMNTNLDETNGLLKENIANSQKAHAAIKENTAAATMMTDMTQAMTGGLAHSPYLFPLAFLLIIALLIAPLVILMRLSKNIVKKL